MIIAIASLLVRHRVLEAVCAYLVVWNHVNRSAGSFRWSYSLPPDHISDRPKAGVWSSWMFAIYWVMQYIPTLRKSCPLHLQGQVLKDVSNLGGPNKLYMITQVRPLCKTCVKTKKRQGLVSNTRVCSVMHISHTAHGEVS